MSFSPERRKSRKSTPEYLQVWQRLRRMRYRSRLRSSFSTAFFRQRAWNSHSAQCRFNTRSGGEGSDSNAPTFSTTFRASLTNAGSFTLSVAKISSGGSFKVMQMPARIEIRPEVLRGKPCIKGTRIPVYLLLQKMAAGESQEQILASYPQRACRFPGLGIAVRGAIFERDGVRDVATILVAPLDFHRVAEDEFDVIDTRDATLAAAQVCARFADALEQFLEGGFLHVIRG